MSSPTRPDGIAFRPVSPILIRVRMVGSIISWSIVVAICVAVGYYMEWWGMYVTAGVAALLCVWRLFLIPRQVRAIGYYEGESEFLVVRGIMFQELTVIPYGRIQYVDISEGPIARRYGIAEITLHTASSDTSGHLEGLPVAEASRLRDLLASRGSAEQAGL